MIDEDGVPPRFRSHHTPGMEYWPTGRFEPIDYRPRAPDTSAEVVGDLPGPAPAADGIRERIEEPQTVEAVPLTREHVRIFEPETPMPGEIKADQYGQALAFVCGERVLAIVAAWEVHGVAVVGLKCSVEARKHPVAMLKNAQMFIHGLHLMGYARVRAGPPKSPRESRWLRHLGFKLQPDGEFEKWQPPL